MNDQLKLLFALTCTRMSMEEIAAFLDIHLKSACKRVKRLRDNGVVRVVEWRWASEYRQGKATPFYALADPIGRPDELYQKLTERELHRRYDERHPGKIQAARKAWTVRNAERVREMKRRHDAARRAKRKVVAQALWDPLTWDKPVGPKR